jgi:hypothetical protein
VTISVYTGSRVWQGLPKIGPAKKTRVEFGPGLYFTTSGETARTYAKGQRTVLRVELDPKLTWLEEAIVPLDVVKRWVKGRPGLRRKKEILRDLDTNAWRTAERIGEGNIRADVLVNLMVNYRSITGPHGPALAEFLVDLGISASHVDRFGEDWIILFDPRKVISWRQYDPNDPWDLPRVKRTSRPT